MQAPSVPFAWYTPLSVNHDLKKDAQTLYDAMKGFGTKDDVLIALLANRNLEERNGIVIEYSHIYHKDAIKDVKAETSGDFEKGLVALLTDQAISDSKALINSMKSLGTNDEVLTEILVTRNNAQKANITEIYHKIAEKSLKDDISSSSTSSDYKNLLEALLESRDESWIVDQASAGVDTETLYKAAETKNVTDFIKILSSRNFLQIREIARIYENAHEKRSLEKTIEGSFPGDIGSGLKSIVSFSQDSFAYFARLLHKPMAGLGTNTETLIRNIVYCQPFINEVFKAYSVLFRTDLKMDIQSNYSGAFRKLLIDLV